MSLLNEFEKLINEKNSYTDPNSLEQKWKDGGVDLSLIVSGDKYLKLVKIVIPKSLRGEGVGSKIMNDIIELADTMKRTVVLTPSKDFGATSIPRLIKFYKRFGFIENKGKNKDFDINDSMYRLPKGN